MNIMKRAAVPFVCVLLAGLLFAGCTPAGQNAGTTASPTAAPAAASGGGVAFEGLLDGAVTMEVDELRAMKSVERSVTSLDSQGEINECTAKGVLLNDFLEAYGKKQTDFNVIRATASDGYVVEIPKEVIDAEDIILAYELDGKPLDEDNAPVRIIIDNVRSLYWARMVCKVEFLSQAQEAEVRRVVVLESTYADLEKTPYEYFDDGVTSEDTAVSMSELLGKYAKGERADTFHITAYDGMKKTQQKEIIEKFSLKIDGRNAPMLTSREVPVGMHVKGLFMLRCGTTVFYSAQKTPEEGEAVALSKIASDTGLSADAYILAATDGYTKEVLKDALGEWYVELSGEDGAVAYQKGAKAKGIKNFLSVTAK